MVWGYLMLAAVWLALGGSVTGWAPRFVTEAIYSGRLYVAGGLCLLLAGVLVLRRRHWTDGLAFFGTAGVLGCLYLGHLTASGYLETLHRDFLWAGTGWMVYFSALAIHSAVTESLPKTCCVALLGLGALLSVVGEGRSAEALSLAGGVAFQASGLAAGLAGLAAGLKRRTGRAASRHKSAPPSMTSPDRKPFFHLKKHVHHE